MAEFIDPPVALPPATSPPPASVRTNSGGPGAVIALIGGVLVVAGSIMPWMTVIDPSGAPISRGGMDASGLGSLTLFLGIIIVALAGARFATTMHPLVQALPILPAIFTLIVHSVEQAAISQWIYRNAAVGHAFIGSGMNILFYGAITTCVGSVIIRRHKTRS